MDRKIAIQIRYHERCYETFKLAAECGFKYVSLALADNCEWFYEDNWKEEVKRLKSALNHNGLKCVMTHMPYYSLLLSAEVLDEQMEIAMLRCVKATSMLGAEIVALHPRAFFVEKTMQMTDKEDITKSFLYNIRNILPLLEEAEKCGCMIGIENLPTYPKYDISFYSNFPEEHKKLIDAFSSPNVCAVWDFGHANLANKDHVKAIETLGRRIKGTHVHNNFGAIDDHLPPSMGKVDWKDVMTALRNTGFEGYLTTEAIMTVDHAFKSYLEHLKECLEKLDDMLHE